MIPYFPQYDPPITCTARPTSNATGAVLELARDGIVTAVAGRASDFSVGRGCVIVDLLL